MRKALIVVDMQNDFISGTLAVPRAQEIVGPIQDKLRDSTLMYDDHEMFVMFTRDAHPINHCSFNGHGGQWPMHCVKGTMGSELQFGLLVMADLFDWPIFLKGENPHREQYSGATDDLVSYLKKNDLYNVEVCGLATDYCVKATAEDLVKLGYKVTILGDLCRAVNSENN